jgi:hypothetical protein
VMRVLGSKLLTIDEHRAALEAAAFRDVVVFEEKKKGWLCVVGVRSPEAEGVTNHVGQSRPPFATR